MRAYLDLLQLVLDEGVEQKDRTGTAPCRVRPPDALRPRRRLPAAHHQEAAPALDPHRTALVPARRHQRPLAPGEKVSIWDEWADERAISARSTASSGGDWEAPDGREIDQIANLIDLIKRDPASRRQIVTAWNPAEIHGWRWRPATACSRPRWPAGKLHLQLYQRSADIFLGVPFNIASYALLTHMLAQQCGLEPGTFVWTGGDCHLYSNHLEQARLQLTREPRHFAEADPEGPWSADFRL